MTMRTRDDPVFSIDETAAELLNRCHRRVLRTGILPLDTALGGLTPGELLEVWSARGGDGSELLHNIVAMCALPRGVDGVALHGEEREVVYVDTGGNLKVHKLEQIIRHRVQAALADSPSATLDCDQIVLDSLSHVHVYDCVDHVELVLALESMKQLTFDGSSRPSDSWLLAIDSISQFHYLAKFEKPGLHLENQLATLLGFLMREAGAVAVTTVTAFKQGLAKGAPQEFLGGMWSRLSGKKMLVLSPEEHRMTAQIFEKGFGSVSTRQFSSVRFEQGQVLME